MMEKTKIVCLSLLLLAGIGRGIAQDIEVRNYKLRLSDLYARRNLKNDLNGVACAVVKCNVPDTSFVIGANAGVVNTEKKLGEIIVWVPVGTRWLEFRHDGARRFQFDIPDSIKIESKKTYGLDVYLSNIRVEPIMTTVSPKEQTAAPTAVMPAPSKTAEKRRAPIAYIGAGFNVLSIMGPSAALGLDIRHHVIEVGGVYGLNKTGMVYFYDKSYNLKANYTYKAMRLQLRYGYDIKPVSFLGIMPQVGAALTCYNGTAVSGMGNSTEDYKKASSVSGFAALRLTVAFGRHLKLQVTPEYDLGLYKSSNCKLISWYENKFNRFTQGPNLNAGLMVCF